MFEDPNVRTLAETLKAILCSADPKFDSNAARLALGVGLHDRV
jgi:hypothetical protein